MRRTPEFTQFDRVKSMLRKWPAKGIAGLHCHRVNSPRRVPFPPASTNANVSRDNSRIDHHRVFFAGAGGASCVPAAHHYESRGVGCWTQLQGEASRAAAKPAGISRVRAARFLNDSVADADS